MSVKAIREGRVDLKYDGWFIYGEVNADVVAWYFDVDPRTHQARLITAKIGLNTKESVVCAAL